MHAVSRLTRSIALGGGWLALLILAGSAVAAPRTDTQLAAAGDGPQLARANASTVVQAPRPSPVDNVSRAMEERLNQMVLTARPAAEH